MACGCGKHGAVAGIDAPRSIRPGEPCVFCAEKHFSTAYALDGENGYGAVNRMRLIGELVLAQWHLWQQHPDTAAAIRNIRHAIEHHQAVPAEAWMQPAEALAQLTADAAKLEKKGQTP